MALPTLSFFTREENRTWQDIRGWLLPSAAEELYRCASLADPRGAVAEIGSFAGKSTVCIARAVKESRRESPAISAIDVKFQPDFRGNLNRFAVSEFTHTLEMSSLDAAEAWTQPIAFLYIDGHHGKAHACADLLVWDLMVMSGGILALDDTAGFFLGPNLQMQVALRTGAYEPVSDVAGVSFLKKKQGIVPSIGDFPLSQGSLIAYVDYIGARSGAMDPPFRLPSALERRAPQQPAAQRRQLLSRLWDASPRKMTQYIRGKLTFDKDSHSGPSMAADDNEIATRIRKLRDVSRILEWLEGMRHADETTPRMLAYLRACVEMQSWRVENAIGTLQTLSELDSSFQFLHYRISIRDMSTLRLAQAHDSQGDRNLARQAYLRVLNESAVPEIRSQAERGLSAPFRLQNLRGDLLLREYNLDLAGYRDILLFTR